MILLGINAYHGDVSAALLRDGQLIAAVEEERFRRVKHWAGFPSEAIQSCLKMAGASAKDVDFFAISRNPRANLFRKTLFALSNRPQMKFIADRTRNVSRVLTLADRISRELDLDPNRVRRKIRWVEHHPAHQASAFFVSPFEEAAVCALDGFGDFASTSFAVGRDRHLQTIDRVFFPHSLGMLYLAITQYLGFHQYGDEYKVMGLAAYGQPEYVQPLRRLIQFKPDGGFELSLPYFRHHREGLSMTWDEGEPVLGPVYTERLEELLGPARKPDEPIEPRHKAIAASLQNVFEEAVCHILNTLYRRTRIPRLCLAGGCALNSTVNGKILRETPFKELYIQPAAADNGTSLGAALYLQHHLLGRNREFVMEHAYWGPKFSQAEMDSALRERSADLVQAGGRMISLEHEEELCDRVAERLAQGKIVGWFQGRMEWGPRALGNRSILADPRRREIRDLLNTKIKFRERFRPFAPSILEEAVREYFPGAAPDPFMLRVYPIQPQKRAAIPAVTHVDGSGRLQAVSQKSNPLFWRLLKAFERRTGVPVLLNTSFNENEPIVFSPSEALDCFLRTGMDLLALGQTVIEKPC